jgi:hypothetical protein
MPGVKRAWVEALSYDYVACHNVSFWVLKMGLAVEVHITDGSYRPSNTIRA